METQSGETLQQLVDRRRREIGGTTRDGRLTVQKLWERGVGGGGDWSQEAARKIVNKGHTAFSGRIAAALAIGLDVRLSEILAAAGQRPALGRFQLPDKAGRLTDSEREVILRVIDVILSAADSDRQPGRDTHPGDSEHHTHLGRLPSSDNSSSSDGAAAGRAETDEQKRRQRAMQAQRKVRGQPRSPRRADG